MSRNVKELEEKIGYNFKDSHLLGHAVTHSSYVNEKHMKKADCNERLEFLGDAVLELISSEYLFFENQTMPEGELTKLRAALVCEKALCQYAIELGLGNFLFLGKGEESTGGRKRPSILADAFEAVIAAIYLDGGMEPATEFVLHYVVPAIENHTPAAFKDYKTILQEIIQKNPEERVTYELVEESGPDHNKHFVVEVHLNSNVIGRGEGRSKKNAEQAAAKVALELMGQ